MSHECIFTYNDIKSAVSHLKPHKSDGNSGLSSNHIINASDLFFTHLALLFTAVVIHGRVPDSFLLSTIIPIPKGNNVDKADSSNFRGIALSLYGCELWLLSTGEIDAMRERIAGVYSSRPTQFLYK